ncbi:MAG: hypothetical protein ABIL05_03100, partial [candidate division WOR-3 bacterium]
IPTLIGVLIFCYTLFFSYKLDRIMASPDPRHKAYDWSANNIPAGKTIGFDFLPQAFYPSINLELHKALHMQMDYNRLPLIDYYVANDQVYLQFLRLAYRYPRQAQYFRTILYSSSFKLLARFENELNILGMKFKKVNIPHDYLYFMPRVEIYERAKNL